MARTVFQAFRESAAMWPENVLFCVPAGREFAPEGIELTFAQVARKVDALAEAYRDAGYGPGHRIALLLDNRPEHFIHFLALNAAGCSQTPLNPDHRPDEMRYQIEHSEAELVVCLERHAKRAAEALAGLQIKQPIVIIEHWPERLPPPRTARAETLPSAATEAGVLYTSGTTARPKGCVLSNEHLLSFGQWYIDYSKTKESIFQIRFGQERLMNPLPVYHVAAGALSFISMMLTGNCLVMPGRFSPRLWWQEVMQTRTTIVHYIGLVPTLLLAQDPTPEEKLHRVRWGLGAGIEPEVHAAFEKRFGFPNVEVWGMTEIARWTADDQEPRRIGLRACGKPIRDLEVRVVDEEDNDVPIGQSGELLVRASGPNPRKGFFDRYLHDAAATELAWRGGWFHTGDHVRQETDGMLFFVDRKKNIIRRSGENIAAAEIENVLLSDPAVAYAAVIAVPDHLRQEEVFACIVPRQGTNAGSTLAERLFRLCLDKLAYYKAPAYLAFFETLPLTATQKVQKQRIFHDKDPLKTDGLYNFTALKKPNR